MPEPVHLEGHCYCGGIAFCVDIPGDEEPIFTAYCHCDSCRRAHAAPLYRVVCVDASWLSFTAGESLLSEYAKPGKGIVRAFCGRCGSKILNRFPSWTPGGNTPIVFFPDLLAEGTQADLPTSLRPLRNNCADECVLDWERLAELRPA